MRKHRAGLLCQLPLLPLFIRDRSDVTVALFSIGKLSTPSCSPPLFSSNKSQLSLFELSKYIQYFGNRKQILCIALRPSLPDSLLTVASDLVISCPILAIILQADGRDGENQEKMLKTLEIAHLQQPSNASANLVGYAKLQFKANGEFTPRPTFQQQNSFPGDKNVANEES
ncbi:hypothetical protein EAI_07103 [Harpegnathos saltator]|uniref:Uncharacterized protein n=1 Tax=Harpegnathos saltator TaxID=610380 RepID=E2BVU0_HARSA|nr:hypothetical protein EAI_07103 [Harpegnathos saltator]